MNGRARVLGIEIDLLDTKEAFDKTSEYISGEGLNLVYLVDNKICMDVIEDSKDAKLIEKADIVLPANDTTEESIAEVLGHSKGKFSIVKYFDEILTLAEVEGIELLIITNTKQELEDILSILDSDRQYLPVRGDSLDIIGQDNHEQIANAINSVAPDILVLCLDNDIQLKFLENYKNKINTSLCICAGSAFLEIWLKKGKTIYNTIISSLFKKRVKKNIIER